jgi:type VI secretion system protein ImpC
MSPAERQKQPDSQSATTRESLLDAAIGATKQTEPDRARELIKTLTEAATDESLRGAIRFDRNVIKTISAGVEAIDAIISEQLAAIMHRPEFLKLEGTWRGLHYLVSKSETGESLKLRVLNCP